jgi:ribonuclease P protein component
MLAKRYRIPLQDKQSQAKATYHCPSFTVKIFVNTLPYGRVGVVASKAALPLATARNYFKRSVFQYFHDRVSGLAGTDILVIAAKSKNLPRAKDVIIKELQNFSEKYL